jgi:hypothetical protein
MLQNCYPLSLMARPNKPERYPWKPFPVKSWNLRARPEPTQLEHLSDASSWVSSWGYQQMLE